MSQDKNTTPENTEETYEGILGDYTETEEPEAEPPKKKEKAKKAEKKPDGPKKSNKALTIACISASAVILGCLGVVGVNFMRNQPSTSKEAAASTENMEVSKQMMACYYQDIIAMYGEYYGADMLLSYYQLDITQPLKDQPYPAGDGTTWFTQVMAQAKQTVSQQLMVAEAAKAAGFVMTEEMEQSVEQELLEFDVSTYGNGVTIDDLRDMLRLQNYGLGYYEEYTGAMDFSDEEVEAYYTENRNTFDTCGYAIFAITADPEEAEDETSDAETETQAATEAPTEEETEKLTKEQAEKLANDLAASKNIKSFETLAERILLEYEGYTEDEAETALASIYNDSYYYSEGSEVAEWAFGGAKVGETYVVEAEDTYYVYMLTREPSRDDSKTVNVRHILFMTNEHLGEDGDNDAALAECHQLAENTLNEWKNGAATEDSFGELAAAYTEDTGSQSTGGKYENVYEGQMVQAFNDWCFDPSRKPGDTGIVETEYGVHVMYYVSDADPMWKADTLYYLRQNALEKWFAELETLYPVTFFDEVIDSIEG